MSTSKPLALFMAALAMSVFVLGIRSPETTTRGVGVFLGVFMMVESFERIAKAWGRR